MPVGGGVGGYFPAEMLDRLGGGRLVGSAGLDGASKRADSGAHVVLEGPVVVQDGHQSLAIRAGHAVVSSLLYF
ncbi:MAG: hypothetical protein ACRDYE_05480 [Acidimicrobiales bacterium]